MASGSRFKVHVLAGTALICGLGAPDASAQIAATGIGQTPKSTVYEDSSYVNPYEKRRILVRQHKEEMLKAEAQPVRKPTQPVAIADESGPKLRVTIPNVEVSQQIRHASSIIVLTENGDGHIAVAANNAIPAGGNPVATSHSALRRLLASVLPGGNTPSLDKVQATLSASATPALIAPIPVGVAPIAPITIATVKSSAASPPQSLERLVARSDDAPPAAPVPLITSADTEKPVVTTYRSPGIVIEHEKLAMNPPQPGLEISHLPTAAEQLAELMPAAGPATTPADNNVPLIQLPDASTPPPAPTVSTADSDQPVPPKPLSDVKPLLDKPQAPGTPLPPVAMPVPPPLPSATAKMPTPPALPSAHAPSPPAQLPLPLPIAAPVTAAVPPQPLITPPTTAAITTPLIAPPQTPLLPTPPTLPMPVTAPQPLPDLLKPKPAETIAPMPPVVKPPTPPLVTEKMPPAVAATPVIAIAPDAVKPLPSSISTPSQKLAAKKSSPIAAKLTPPEDASEPPSQLSAQSKAILHTFPSNLDKKKKMSEEEKHLSVDRARAIQDVFKDDGNETVRHESMGINIEINHPKLNMDYELGRAYDAIAAGHSTSAIEIYKTVLENDPNNKGALFGLATLYHRAGQIEMARPLYGRLLAIDPKNRDGLNNFLVLLADESPQEALTKMQELEARNPDFSPIPAQMAVIYQKLGDTDKASEEMVKAVDLAPDNLAYHYNLAIILDKQGKYDEAAKLYRQIIEAYQRGETPPGNIEKIQQRLTFISSNRP